MATNDKSSSLLILQIDSLGDIPDDDLENLKFNLKRELIEFGLTPEEIMVSEELPGGAKTVDPITIGALAIAVLPSLLPKCIELVQQWTIRGEDRRVKIKTQKGDRLVEVEFSPKVVSPEELAEIVELLSGEKAEK